MSSNFKSLLYRRQKIVEKALQSILPKASAKPSIIHKAMRYSVEAGGKRLRPVLVMAGAAVCGGDEKKVLPTACALEMIHTYSLVHDDLPAMDDDDLRRGRPTNHIVFGEDIAILAGDALLTYAFELMASNSKVRGVSGAAVADVMGKVAHWAGTTGMVGGQVADIKADQGRWKKLKGKEFSNPKDLLNFIHLHKTAALIRASLWAGGRLAGASPSKLNALDRYAIGIGLAFQVQDDVLDLIGNKKKLGKKGSDRANQKLTYPVLYGIDSSKKKAEQLIAQSQRALKVFGSRAKFLHDLADYMVRRDY